MSFSVIDALSQIVPAILTSTGRKNQIRLGKPGSLRRIRRGASPDPAGDAWDRLDQAINMLESEEEDEPESDEVAKSEALRLNVDNTRPQKPS